MVPNARKINIGQIGFGYWGQKLFPYFQSHQNLFVSKVAVNDLAKSRPSLGQPNVCSVSELLAAPDIQAVVVATPPDTHYPLARRVLESGKHLFCEKVFTETAAQAEELKLLAEQKKLKIMVDYTFTFSKAILKMAELVKAGEIGELRAAVFSMQQLGHFVPESVSTLIGCHCLSVLNLVRPLDNLDFTSQTLLARERKAETGSIGFSGHSDDFRGTIILSVNNPQKERRFVLFGSAGTIIYDMMNASNPLRMVKYQATPEQADPVILESILLESFDETQNLTLAVDAFYQMLKGKVPSNIEAALAVNRALERLTTIGRK